MPNYFFYIKNVYSLIGKYVKYTYTFSVRVLGVWEEYKFFTCIEFNPVS